MNGETIITAENIALAAEVICGELPNCVLSVNGAATRLRWHVWVLITAKGYWENKPPTLAELRDEVRERFAEYIQQEDGK